MVEDAKYLALEKKYLALEDQYLDLEQKYIDLEKQVKGKPAVPAAKAEEKPLVIETKYKEETPDPKKEKPNEPPAWR